MEFVIVIVMLLFIGFCAGILGLAVSEAFKKKEGENAMDLSMRQAGGQTGSLERNDRA
jgi:amino acid permease